MHRYTQQLRLGDISPEVACTVFADKRQVGGESDSGVTMPLEMMLLEEFPQDHHFTQYTTPQSMRLRKDMREPTRFDFVAFDLDFGKHLERPTVETFSLLVLHCWLVDYVPNIIYATRGGARIVYVIQPFSDATLFEGHAKTLTRKLAEPLLLGKSGYELDTAASDWTRLFRCPRVVRDDQQEYDYPVRLYHTDTLDLLRFKPVQKKQRTYRPTGRGITNVEQQQLLVEVAARMQPGQRNTELHKCFYKIWKRWPDDAEELFPDIAQMAEHSGLDKREIEATYKSAERGAKNG